MSVHLGTRDGKDFPVLEVGPGVRSPVISRQRLSEKAGDKTTVHVRQNAVYMRSVNNGVVESVEPRSSEDWDTLMETCFDNREAEIGRFLRRHAPALQREIRGPETPLTVTEARVSSDSQPQSTSSLPELAMPSDEPKRTVPATPLAILDKGAAAFAAYVAILKIDKKPVPSERKGWREVGIVCEGPLRPIPSPSLLDELFIRHPRLSGWPVWIDTRGSSIKDSRPYPNQGGWEALAHLKYPGYADSMITFWRLEPAGNFYLRRTYEDDVFEQTQGRHGELLDFVLVISRVAEILGTAQAFARSLSAAPEQSSFRAAFRWTGLSHRELTCWIEPMRDIWTAVPAHEPEIISEISVPLSIPLPSLTPYVEDAVRPLFAAFGITIGSKVVQEIATKTLQRRPLA